MADERQTENDAESVMAQGPRLRLFGRHLRQPDAGLRRRRVFGLLRDHPVPADGVLPGRWDLQGVPGLPGVRQRRLRA